MINAAHARTLLNRQERKEDATSIAKERRLEAAAKSHMGGVVAALRAAVIEAAAEKSSTVDAAITLKKVSAEEGETLLRLVKERLEEKGYFILSGNFTPASEAAYLPRGKGSYPAELRVSFSF